MAEETQIISSKLKHIWELEGYDFEVISTISQPDMYRVRLKKNQAGEGQ